MSESKPEREAPNPRLVIVIDLDNTVQATSLWVKEQIKNKFLDINSQEIIENSDNLKKSPSFAGRQDVVEYIISLQRDNSIITEPPAYTGAIESICDFLKQDAEIYFVTSRGFDQKEATENWFSSNGLTTLTANVIYRPEESRQSETTEEYKQKQISKLKANIVIDDHTQTVNKLKQLTTADNVEIIKLLSLTQPWNKTDQTKNQYDEFMGNSVANYLPNWREIRNIVNRVINIYPLLTKNKQAIYQNLA